VKTHAFFRRAESTLIDARARDANANDGRDGRARTGSFHRIDGSTPRRRADGANRRVSDSFGVERDSSCDTRTD
jgi:hypothetical protein